MQLSKDSIHGKPDSGIGIQRQAIQSNTPLSHVSPACKSITSAGISQMMASPSVKHSDMIKEEEQSDGKQVSFSILQRKFDNLKHEYCIIIVLFPSLEQLFVSKSFFFKLHVARNFPCRCFHLPSEVGFMAALLDIDSIEAFCVSII